MNKNKHIHIYMYIVLVQENFGSRAIVSAERVRGDR